MHRLFEVTYIDLYDVMSAEFGEPSLHPAPVMLGIHSHTAPSSHFHGNLVALVKQIQSDICIYFFFQHKGREWCDSPIFQYGTHLSWIKYNRVYASF